MASQRYVGSWYTPIFNFVILFFGSVVLGLLIGLACAIVTILNHLIIMITDFKEIFWSSSTEC